MENAIILLPGYKLNFNVKIRKWLDIRRERHDLFENQNIYSIIASRGFENESVMIEIDYVDDLKDGLISAFGLENLELCEKVMLPYTKSELAFKSRVA